MQRGDFSNEMFSSLFLLPDLHEISPNDRSYFIIA